MIDLHTHSTASDGSLSPTTLIKNAATAGITSLALTDHDCIKGIPEAQLAADQCGLNLIYGIELSVMWAKQTIHIVGLNININNKLLLHSLDKTLENRQSRAHNIAKKLAQHGIDDTYEGAKKFATTSLISRTHFAQFLVEQGHAKDIRQVFKRFLVPGKPGHVKGEWVSLAQGIALIHQAGGIAVIAHPARYRLSRTKLRRLFAEFQTLGGSAIEVVSGSHSKEENKTMAQHAIDFNLAASAGSDYHGPEKPWVQLGKLPELHYRCTPIWESDANLNAKCNLIKH